MRKHLKACANVLFLVRLPAHNGWLPSLLLGCRQLMQHDAAARTRPPLASSALPSTSSAACITRVPHSRGVPTTPPSAPWPAAAAVCCAVSRCSAATWAATAPQGSWKERTACGRAVHGGHACHAHQRSCTVPSVRACTCTQANTQPIRQTVGCICRAGTPGCARAPRPRCRTCAPLQPPLHVDTGTPACAHIPVHVHHGPTPGQAPHLQEAPGQLVRLAAGEARRRVGDGGQQQRACLTRAAAPTTSLQLLPAAPAVAAARLHAVGVFLPIESEQGMLRGLA